MAERMKAAAKPRTKKSMMDTTCTEVEPGVWQWQDEKYTFRFLDRNGINVQCSVDGGNWQGMIYAQNLNFAVMYTLGFAAGASYQRNLALAAARVATPLDGAVAGD